MPSELKEKLNSWLFEEGSLFPGAPHSVPATTDNFNILSEDNIRSLAIHVSGGWPERRRAISMRNSFDARNSNPNSGSTIGYHFLLSEDGTVSRNIDLRSRTSHAVFVNTSALSVSLGNRFDQFSNGAWTRASELTNTNDIPGANLYLRNINSNQVEIAPSWWTTSEFRGGRRGNHGTPAGASQMLFSEHQYRRLALVAKYILEKNNIPRNFVLLPHLVWPNHSAQDLREGNVTAPDWDNFRRIILADQRCHKITRALYEMTTPHGGTPIQPDVNYTPDDITLEDLYRSNENGLEDTYNNNNFVDPAINRIASNYGWREFFNQRGSDNGQFRGVHGHGITQQTKSDCPGPLFNWHRLAREVSDYWWYPFDVDGAAGPNQGMPHENVIVDGRTYRGYRRFDENTPILDYYWDEKDSEDYYSNLQVPNTSSPATSPSTFVLDTNTPIYAMSNGELVAAKLSNINEEISSGFLLVRHYVFHNRFYDSETESIAINYNQRPSVVYSLYMHVVPAVEISFTQPHIHNPDWLNRIIIRKKECDLGVAFYDDDDRNNNSFPEARWDNNPPTRDGYPPLPTTINGWRVDQKILGQFINDLQNGLVAIPEVVPQSEEAHFSQPINIIQGDYFGDSGSVNNQLDGIRIEIFSPTLKPETILRYDESINGEWINEDFPLNKTSEWDDSIQQPIAFRYASEWKDTEWWQNISKHLNNYLLTNPEQDRLPLNGIVNHFNPLVYMEWINNVTWNHEWEKFQVTDINDNELPCPRRPRTRRIPPAE